MECNIKRNLSFCSCSYPGCEKKGKCCECLHYHLKRKEVPACFFSLEIERTYERSIENFIKHYKG